MRVDAPTWVRILDALARTWDRALTDEELLRRMPFRSTRESLEALLQDGHVVRDERNPRLIRLTEHGHVALEAETATAETLGEAP